MRLHLLPSAAAGNLPQIAHLAAPWKGWRDHFQTKATMPPWHAGRVASRFPNSSAEGRICSQSAISADAGARYGANPNAKMERFAKPVILMAPLTPALSACSAEQWYGDGEPVGTENGKTVYSSTGSPRVGTTSKAALQQCLKRAEIRCGGKTAYEVKAIRRTGTPWRENGFTPYVRQFVWVQPTEILFSCKA